MSDSGEGESCSMTGLLGILIQLGLGVLSFSVLIVKRVREKPQRPWKIWVFDTSKQLVSQLLAHFINLTISIALSYNDDSSDECLWYFMTNILDNTLGVLICVICLRAIEWSLLKRNRRHYISGNYYSHKRVLIQIQIMDVRRGHLKDDIQLGADSSGDYPRKGHMNEEVEPEPPQEPGSQPPADQPAPVDQPATQSIDKYQINYQAWLVQLLIWVSVVCIGKGVLFGFEYGLKDPLKKLSFLIMGWIQNYPVLELIVVIVIVPVVMNGLAFWIQDNFLMKKGEVKAEGQSPLIQEQSTPRQSNAEP